MKDEHIRYGEARLLPTKNVAPFVDRIYEDIITLIKKYIDEQRSLQDLLDYLNEKNSLERRFENGRNNQYNLY